MRIQNQLVLSMECSVNMNSNFYVTDSQPFMEANLGIGNIFHVLSIEYYRSLNYINKPYAKKDYLSGNYANVLNLLI